MAEVIHEQMRIAGERVDARERIIVTNPYTEELVGTVPKAAPTDLRRAFAVAAGYRCGLSRHARAEILRRTAVILGQRREAIAALITAESGLCVKDSTYEVGRAVDVFNLAAQLCTFDDGQIFSCDITARGQARRIYTMREPLVAIAAITPFNHPLNQVAHKIAPSVATGNCMVLKPSEKTPLSALVLADVLVEAGLPPEMFAVVTGDPAQIGDAMITDPAAELVTFTGGAAVGKAIAARAGYRRLVLELGGNAPLIVMDDADIDRAASLAVAGCYKNSGQRCTAVKRVLVHRDIADDFADALTAKTLALRCGDPLDPATDVGAVIDVEAASSWQARVADAIARGAKLRCGHERRGAVYTPTVVDHVPRDCELVTAETFGPVAPIIRFASADEAVEIANDSAFGLSAGVCTNRLDLVTKFISSLRTGTVNIWEVPGYRIELSPFGGIKDSGLGYKEGVLEAMKSFTNVKTYSLPWPL